jgi:hypothetical protein
MTKIRKQWTISLLKDAIKAQKSFFETWGKTERITELTDQEIKVIKEAFILRIHPLLCFDMIVKANKGKAIELLLDWYLGKGVCPETKHGGYESELNVMLNDLSEFHGIEALSELLNSDNFDKGKLNDPRVLRSFQEALEIEDAEYTVIHVNGAKQEYSIKRSVENLQTDFAGRSIYDVKKQEGYEYN